VRRVFTLSGSLYYEALMAVHDGEGVEVDEI
jgi:hypothetical protein